jgi:glycosyltransferase involved in cell wall biosynthesis
MSSAGTRGLRIAIVLYTSGSVSGGAAKHFRILPPLIARDPRVADVRLFVPAGAVREYPPGLEVFDWPVGKGTAGGKALREALAAYAPSVVFIPSARYVSASDTPTVVMVRNMEPLLTPFAGNRILDRLKNVARRLAARRACDRADRVIAVSDHVRDFLVARWGIPDARIGTVPHGIESPPSPLRPASLRALGDRRFIFSMGSIRPARGLIDLIEALGAGTIASDIDLVFAGKVDAGAEHYWNTLLATASRRGISNRVHWAGQLGPQEISWCFTNARLFVMTSRAEACPNTVLEALAHGSFSVSGDNAPMPEFFRDCALYYRNGDSASLATTLSQALSLEAEEEAAMRARSLARAAQFTWQECARKTVDELARAVSLRNR